jgi:hypothetical protein
VRIKSLNLKFSSVILLLIVVSVLTSCVKSPNKIGAEIMPEDSKLQLFLSDTTTVYAYSEVLDSIRSDELTYNYLGSIVDPVFGTTIAGVFTQFTLSSLGHDFGPNPQMDSLILQMAYVGFYGDTTSTVGVHAYEMEELMEFDQDYYSNVNFAHSSQDYLNYSFVPRTNDSTYVYDSISGDSTVFGPVQRFNLGDYNPGLGNKLLSADTTVMGNSTNFKEFFKGLYLITEPVQNDGVLLRFNLLDTKTGMILYYKNDTADSLRYNYVIGSTTPRVSRYEHNYFNAEADFKNQVIDGDTSLGTQMFYTQGFAGVRGHIKFPYLREWARKGNIAINEAKLIFSGYEEEPYNGEPAALLLLELNEDGSQSVMLDQYEGESYFGGEYQSSTKEYVFRITNHIFKLISDTSLVDYGLYVYPNASSINPKRFIFNGNQPANDTINPFRVEIIYTDLN